MRDYKSLSHTRWDCKYHIVFIPKKRKKIIYGSLRKYLGEIFHDLAKKADVKVEEGHLMKDHVHMCLSIAPKYAVSNVVGYLKLTLRKLTSHSLKLIHSNLVCSHN